MPAKPGKHRCANSEASLRGDELFSLFQWPYRLHPSTNVHLSLCPLGLAETVALGLAEIVPYPINPLISSHHGTFYAFYQRMYHLDMHLLHAVCITHPRDSYFDIAQGCQ